MTVFNDLIDELKNEQLLDDCYFDSDTELKKFDGAQITPLSSIHTTVNDFYSAFPTYGAGKPEITYPQLKEIEANSVIEKRHPPYYSISSLNALSKTTNLIKHKTKRNKKTGGLVCKNCNVVVPFYYFYCSFCHKRLIGNLYLYSTIMFSALIFTIIVLYIITSKSYR